MGKIERRRSNLQAESTIFPMAADETVYRNNQFYIQAQ